MIDRVMKMPSDYPLWRIENDWLYRYFRIKYHGLGSCVGLEVMSKNIGIKIISQHHDPPTCEHLVRTKTMNIIIGLSYVQMWPDTFNGVSHV